MLELIHIYIICPVMYSDFICLLLCFLVLIILGEEEIPNPNSRVCPSGCILLFEYMFFFSNDFKVILFHIKSSPKIKRLVGS